MRLSLRAGTAPRLRTTKPVLNVAHRGASEVAPENTLAAVRRAVALGADLVEVDVRRTRDGALVLMHDATLGRTTNVARVFPDRGPWRVGDLTYDEVAILDAGSWKGSEHEGEPVPMLEEVVELLRGTRTGLLVEVKEPRAYPGVMADVAATLRESAVRTRHAGVSPTRLVVESFDIAAMKELKTLDPSLTVGLLGAPARANLPALGTWADQVNPHHRAADASYVDRVHAAGMECLVWTVNRRQAMQRALGLGVDGVITNRPGVLKHLMGTPPAIARL